MGKGECFNQGALVASDRIPSQVNRNKQPMHWCT